MPQASQSSYDRRAELEVLLAIPSAQSACGMEIRMDKKTTLEMIAAISNANGTSGFEDEVVAAIRPYAEGLGEITEDCMRNLYILSLIHISEPTRP